jgi:hypothetical protein
VQDGDSDRTSKASSLGELGYLIRFVLRNPQAEDEPTATLDQTRHSAIAEAVTPRPSSTTDPCEARTNLGSVAHSIKHEHPEPQSCGKRWSCPR